MNRTTLLAFGLIATLPVATLAQDDAGDTPKDAKRASKNGNVRGLTLFSAADIDFFRFDVKADKEIPGHDPSGNITVKFSQKAPPGANPNAGWRLDLYAEEDLANSLYTTTLKETSLEVGFEQGLGAGRYYYKVSSLNEEVFPTAEYTLTGSWEENPNYERSPNEDIDNANVLRVNETYFGNLSSTKDVDVYRFGLETPDLVTINFTQDNPGADSAIGWQLRLLSPTLVEPLQIDLPSTKLQGTPVQAQLEAGVHFIFVRPLPPTNEEERVQTPVGKTYALNVIAASVPPKPQACNYTFVYAQNPLTHRWGTFSSPCDVPLGWFSQATPPEASEVCPSPHASYTFPSVADDGTKKAGRVRIPLLDLTDGGNELVLRVEMEQEEPTEAMKFKVSDFKVLRVNTPTIDETLIEEPVP